MRRNMTQVRTALTACIAATIFWMTPAAVAQDTLRTPPGPPVSFVNGGVTQEEADQLRAQASMYPLEIRFARAADGAFAADVHVRIVDASGRQVFVLPAAEPILLAKLPPGTYTVEATFEGQTKRQQVNVGRSHQKLGFAW
jgi:hypothetical protein